MKLVHNSWIHAQSTAELNGMLLKWLEEQYIVFLFLFFLLLTMKCNSLYTPYCKNTCRLWQVPAKESENFLFLALRLGSNLDLSCEKDVGELCDSDIT